MRVELYGTRGSLARAGPSTVRYGGDTASTRVDGEDGQVVILDAGSGILRLGERLPEGLDRVDVLLSHLHMEHIQGLGFFRPMYDPDVEVHIWGPASATMGLRSRLARYLSPPLFPVMLRDLEGVFLHTIEPGTFSLGGFEVTASLIIHPGPTLGLRLTDGRGTLAYLSDHEPALGVSNFPEDPAWTSGYDVAASADVLIHDSQYTAAEHAERIGWGHSTLDHAAAFARLTEVGVMVTFHHDPNHTDDFLDRELEGVRARHPDVHIEPGCHGMVFAPGVSVTPV